MILQIQVGHPYEIQIEPGCIKGLGKRAAQLFPKAARCCVIGDSHTLPLYGKTAEESLKTAGFSVSTVSFEAGEARKTLTTISSFYDAFCEAHLTRTDFVVALGGGVTGDMAGFAAASFLRGIPFIQVPTSLLSQIDSSVGGKTGVDLPQGKNMVGAFHQPSFVLIDPNTLKTLPDQFFSDGMGEAIKYGCIKSRVLFDFLKENHIDSLRQSSEKLCDLIRQCIEIKRAVVERDEFDTGERMMLNFGHTFGHALERLQSYGGLTHGAAVGIGCVIAAKIGEGLGITPTGTHTEIAELLQKYALSTSFTESIDDLIAATGNDKKSTADSINLVLLHQIGDAFLRKTPRSELPKLCEVLR